MSLRYPECVDEGMTFNIAFWNGGQITTPKFMDFEMVYLPKNRFIKEEQLHTEQFLLNFFPFEKPHLMKSGKSYA